jgi:RNA polymerase sigma-70 factor (ECF subfamily)
MMSLSSMRTPGALAVRLGRIARAEDARPFDSAVPLKGERDLSEINSSSFGSDELRDATTIPSGRGKPEAADHELLKLFQDGDEKGYVELYVRRQAELYTYCLRLTAGDRDLSSDIFQDVWIKVYRKAHTFREGTNVLGWLYTIAKTTFLNHRRQRSHVSLDDQHEWIESSDRSMHPEFRTEQQTIKTRVEDAIARLPLEIREPFILREFDGFSYVDIAQQLSITHGAVRQRIYRAKQAMREMLVDLIDDGPMALPADDVPANVRKNDHGNV